MCAFWRRKARAARKVAKRVRKKKKRKKKKARRELRAERRKEKKLKKAEKKKAKQEKKEKAKDVPTATNAAAAGGKAVAATPAVAATATLASSSGATPPASTPQVTPEPSAAHRADGRQRLSPEAEAALVKLTRTLTDPSVDIDDLAKRLRANRRAGSTRDLEPDDCYFLSKSDIVLSAAMTSAQTTLFLTELSNEGPIPIPPDEQAGEC